MAKKNQKHEHKPDQQPTPQPTAPATPLELSEEELAQVGGGSFSWGASATPPTTGPGGLPGLTSN